MEGETEIEEQVKLIQKIKGSDRDAEAHLYQKYRDRFLYFTRRKMFMIAGEVDVELARDVCQDAWMAVLENLRAGEVQKPEKLLSYIYQVFSNKVIDSLRMRCKERPLENLEKYNPPRSLVDDSQPTSKHRETFAKVWRELKPKERRIFYLKYIHGWSHNQIASILEISEENSRKMLQRAKERMRKKFGKGL